jgi:hypothetical protein
MSAVSLCVWRFVFARFSVREAEAASLMVASHKHERVRVALGELVYDAQHPVSAPHLSE